jgi:hypothetical protein
MIDSKARDFACFGPMGRRETAKSIRENWMPFSPMANLRWRSLSQPGQLGKQNPSAGQKHSTLAKAQHELSGFDT